MSSRRIGSMGAGAVGSVIGASVVAMTMSPCSSSRADAPVAGRAWSRRTRRPAAGRSAASASRSPRPMTGHRQQADVAPEPGLRRSARRAAAGGMPAGAVARRRVADARGQAQVDQRDRIGQRGVAVGPLVLARRTPRRARRAGRPRSRPSGQRRWSARTTGRCSAGPRSGVISSRPSGGRAGQDARRPPSSIAREGAIDRPSSVAASSGRMNVRTRWCSRSASSRPTALKTPGAGGTMTVADPEPDRHLGREQRPVAAERDEAELARVAAALDGHGADRARHPGAAQQVDAVGGVLERQAERRRDLVASTARRASSPSSRSPLGSRSSCR